MRRWFIALLGAALLTASLVASPAAAAGLPMSLVKDGLSEPVFVTNAGDDRLFVVEQGGLIKIVEPDNSVKTFLDVSGLILHDAERGLFSLAFHPDFASNGLFYIDYTRASDGASTVAEYHVSQADPDVADPASARIVVVVDQPNPVHNGGWIGFKGNNLYITVGDGGSPGDRLNYGQSKTVLNGKILRINPLDPDGTGPRAFSVPPGNPFVGVKGRDAIWSLGLRNTWRCSFDEVTGKLWCGDVGERTYEEIDRVKTRVGHNFGWHFIEGFHYFRDPGHKQGKLCVSDCKTLPIAEYSHAANAGPCASVVGGYVARRPDAALYGTYVFGDYCSGNIWTIPATFKAGTALPDPVTNIGEFRLVSFGVDRAGHVLLVDHTGSIFRLGQS